MMTKITNGSNLVLFWTQSSKVCLLFRKGRKETKGLCRRKECRQVGPTQLTTRWQVGMQVPIQGGGCCWLPSMFDCTVNTGAQLPEDVEQPLFLSLAFSLVWVKNKRNFLQPALPFPSLPFHSIPFFLKKWTTFCFQFLFLEFVIFGCICYVVFLGVFIMVLFICGVCARSHFDWPIITKLLEQWTSLQ